MRRELSIVISVISLLLFALLTTSGRGARLSDFAVDDGVWNNTISDKKLADEALLDSLFFDDEELFYDSDRCRYYYSLTEGYSSRLDPGVKWVSKGGADVSVIFDRKGYNEQMVTDSEPVRVLMYSDEEYMIAEVYATSLPILSIDYDPNISVDLNTREPVPMTFRLYDNRAGAEHRNILSDGTFHVRGASSRQYPKLCWRLSLTETSEGNHVRKRMVSLLGMRQDDDWLLYAGYNDPEKVREVFNTNLWYNSCADSNQYGLKNGLEYRFVEVLMNGRYWGLYALGYPVDQKMLGIKEDETGLPTEYIIKARTGLHYDEIQNYQRGLPVKGMRLENLSEDDVTAWACFLDYMNIILTDDNVKNIYEHIDMANQVDIYLFFNMIQGFDNMLKNYYITLKDNGEVAMYTPWDLNCSWGNGSQDHMSYIYSIDKNPLFHNGIGKLVLCNDEKAIESIKARYKELRNGAWSDGAMSQMIDDLEEDIYLSGAYSRERERWPEGDYLENGVMLTRFRAYIRDRMNYLDGIYQ